MVSWYYKNENEPEQGPFSGTELKLVAKAGCIVVSTQVRNDNSKWVPATKVKGLLASDTNPEGAGFFETIDSVVQSEVVNRIESHSQPNDAYQFEPERWTGFTVDGIAQPEVVNNFEPYSQVPPHKSPTCPQPSCTSQIKPATQLAGFLDVGFTKFIITTCISFIWIFCMILAMISCAVGILIFVTTGDIRIFFFACPVSLILLFVIRLYLELFIVFFRIESHLRALRDNLPKPQ